MGFLEKWSSRSSAVLLIDKKPEALPIPALSANAATVPEPARLAKESLPDECCPNCGRAVFWRGADGAWRCLGCDAPENFGEIRETVLVSTDIPDQGPFGDEEFRLRQAVKLLGSAGVRLFMIGDVPMAGIPRETTPEVLAAITSIHGDQWLFLDDPLTPERYRESVSPTRGNK